MKKTPSIFERDWNGNRSRLLPVIADADVAWVFAGEGIATVKWDGSAVMLDSDRRLWVRYDAKAGKTPPAGFVPAQERDPKTGHMPGWIPAEGNPAAKWHIDALNNTPLVQPGTWEACGPSHQGNPHKFTKNVLVRHGNVVLVNFKIHLYDGPEQAYSACRQFLEHLVLPTEAYGLPLVGPTRAEGIVWHHPDGRMAKVKGSDLGVPWPPV